MPAKWLPGANEAAARVRQMTREQLLSHIDSLYGRSYLPFDALEDEILEEAISQTYEDFRDYSEATEKERAARKYP